MGVDGRNPSRSTSRAGRNPASSVEMYSPHHRAVTRFMYIKSQNAAGHDSTNSIRDPDVVALLADDEVLKDFVDDGDVILHVAPEERLEELARDLGLDDPEAAAFAPGVTLEDAGGSPADVVRAPTVGLEDLGVSDEEARVHFDEDGIARVPQAVGELLAEKFDGEDGRDDILIEKREGESGGDD